MGIRIVCVVVLLVGLTGCTHVQLRRNTIRQSATLTDIYEQQVLDNLAMFVHDQGALPFFAYPNSGGSDVSDSLGGDWTLGFDRAGFASGGLGQNSGRDMSESWVLTPVYDPRRLELMRCVYKQVVADAGIRELDQTNDACELLQRQFYLGAVNGISVQEFTQQTGRTTPASLNPCQWFGYGSEPPSGHGPCCRSGEYCGTHVWVLPGGREELSKLTMIILDYAFNVSAISTEPSQEVVLYFDSNGQPTTEDKANRVIRRIESVRQDVTETSSSNGGNSSVRVRAIELPPIAPADTNTFSPQKLDLQLRLLSPR